MRGFIGIILLGLTMGLVISVVASCLQSEPSPDPLPPTLMNVVKSVPLEDQPSVLSALVTLQRAGVLWQFGWGAPTTGTPPAKYEVYTRYDTPTNSVWVLGVDKYNHVMEVAGIDSLDRMGNVSVPSDSVAIKRFQP